MSYVKAKRKNLKGYKSEEKINDECKDYIKDYIVDGYNAFIEQEGWNESVSDDEPRERNCDIEASYLCHEIWNVVMNNPLNSSNAKNAYIYVKLGNQFVWTDNTSSVRFHFDIMNNPSREDRGEDKGKYSCGLAEKGDASKWLEIYHHIGNMAPVPWFEVAGDHSINSQLLHKSLDERWDLYLNVLRSQWNIWNRNSKFKFEDYMILTCQHMYFKKTYDCILSEFKKNNGLTIDEDKIKEWENSINENSELINFEDRNNAINDIINLIRIRDVLIGVKLSGRPIEIFINIED